MATTPPPRERCGLCGAELSFSHREQAGRGEVRLVLRCRGCGNTVTRVTGARDDQASRPRSKKPPVNEGPPDNPVMDEAMARRLREQFGGGES